MTQRIVRSGKRHGLVAGHVVAEHGCPLPEVVIRGDPRRRLGDGHLVGVPGTFEAKAPNGPRVVLEDALFPIEVPGTGE